MERAEKKKAVRRRHREEGKPEVEDLTGEKGRLEGDG